MVFWLIVKNQDLKFKWIGCGRRIWTADPQGYEPCAGYLSTSKTNNITQLSEKIIYLTSDINIIEKYKKNSLNIISKYSFQNMLKGIIEAKTKLND